MNNLELNEIAGIKVDKNNATVEVVTVIKRYRKGSIFDIRRDILNGEFVLSCNYIENERGIKKLIKCYDELVKRSCNVEVYFAGEKEDIQVLRNWAQTSNEISEEGWEELVEKNN